MGITVEPQGLVYLCKTNLEPDYKHQLTFANATAQQNYFSLNTVLAHSYSGYTYIRKDNAIKIEAPIDTIRDCNYLYYQNKGFTTKYYYCFITGMKYLSENSTLVEIQTDCFQTYMFDLSYKYSFIEREHVASAQDTCDGNTVPEGLETGEYVIASNTEVGIGTSGALVGFMVTNPPYNGAPITYITHSIGNVYSGFLSFATTYQDATKIIDMYNDSSVTTADAIKNIYMLPYECANTTTSETWNDGTRSATIYMIQTNTQQVKTASITESTSFEGYTPKNKKLYTYPYKYFHISNNVGTDVVFKWEDCEKDLTNNINKVNLIVEAIANCGAQSIIYPKIYKNHDTSGTGASQLMNYGVSGAKYPCCAWVTDYYTNWLTQNGVNMSLSVVSSTVSGLGYGASVGGAWGAVGGAAMGALSATTSALGQMYQAATTPDQGHGDTGVGDITFSNQQCAFNVYDMGIRGEYAKIIDEFFTMYGYKINRVKQISFNSRSNWNYIKTVDANIEGNIPPDDLITIKNMFNNGVTMWHNPSTMLDYSQNNI